MKRCVTARRHRGLTNRGVLEYVCDYVEFDVMLRRSFTLLAQKLIKVRIKISSIQYAIELNLFFQGSDEPERRT